MLILYKMKINRLITLIFTLASATFLVEVSPAHAEPTTYRAGNFTITLDNDAELGKTYRGCDAEGNCVNLNNGTKWRDNGYRGIGWHNGEYIYSISWRENSNEGMYLNVLKGEKRILRRKLEAVEQATVPLKWATFCNVVNIQSGQLALRNSPNGKSLAGLNNGNHVYLKNQQGNWAYVSVVKGPNSRVNNMFGWVNSNYLSCSQEPID